MARKASAIVYVVTYSLPGRLPDDPEDNVCFRTLDAAEAYVAESPDRERPSSELGELVMDRLRKLDKVAYVRFASVYLDFKDVREFMDELKDLLKAKTS